MPWIDVIDHVKSTGLLKKELDKAVQRAGRVWNIVGIMSQNPLTMKSSMELTGHIMYGKSTLSRSQREMLAVVTSSASHCVY